MHRVIRRVAVLCLLLLLSNLINAPTALAQSDKPKLQAVSLNGIEPPPPGITAELEWGGWGGDDGTCVTGAYFIAGTGFTPPLPTRDFALRIYCIHDSSTPVKIAFYQITDWESAPHATLIAVREVYGDRNGEVWVHVKVGRSAPFSFDDIGLLLYAPEINGRIIRQFQWEFSTCMNAQVPPVNIGDKAQITPGAANNLRSEPSPKSKKLASMPGGSAITIVDGPECDANGTAYWKVRYKHLEGWTAQGDRDENWIARAKS